MWPSQTSSDSPFGPPASSAPPPPTTPSTDWFTVPSTPPPAPRRRPRRAIAGAAVLVGAVATAGAGGAVAGATFLAPKPIVATPGATTTPAAPAVANPGSTALLPVNPVSVNAPSVADKVVPSVVYIEVSGSSRFNGTAQPIASGSGVVLDTDGHIVTNRHVVDAGPAYSVVLSNGRTYEATLVGEDAATDLAVLKIRASDLTPIALGSTQTLRIGGTTIAVGSPLGLQGGPSLTVGVLSAIGREVQEDQRTTLFGMLQTDAAINEGSSGGALVDEQGRLIGITTAVGVSSVGIEGVGFATPVEIVDRVARELIAKGSATTAALGIQGRTAYTDLQDGGKAPKGVEIHSLQSGAAADKAGLKDGDVITQVDGVAIDTMDELVSQLRRHAAGDTVQLTVDRGGSTSTISVVLGSL
jgi:S1-C subfamily serine protease